MKKMYLIILSIFLISQLALAVSSVTVQQLKGDVQVRQGLEETWSPAGQGLVLKTIDTILTGEAAWVTLELEEGLTFRLGSNAMLDIGDLRKITEQELFLYLTSQKVGRIQSTNKASLHIENVSVVRGARASSSPANERISEQEKFYKLELNGAKALQTQAYNTNAIMKLFKIEQKFPTVQTYGEIDFYRAQAFETVGQSGRAIDAYQSALLHAKEAPETNQLSIRIVNESTEAISRLKIKE